MIRRAVAKAWVAAVTLTGMSSVLSAKTTAWTGTASSNWNDASNWSAGVPASGDDLAFTSGNPPNQPSNNDIANLSLRSLVFPNGTFTGPLTMDGNSLTLDASYGATGTLTNGNTTSGRSVTINNPVTITGAQGWVSTNANGITTFGGNLSGTGTLSLKQPQMQSSGDGVLAAWRLSGTNNAYTGQVRFADQRQGLVLLHPQAMVGGNISLGPGNVNVDRQYLYLQGSSASNPFTFGIGTGLNQVQFNPTSNSSGGLLHDGDQWLRLGGSGDYTWSLSALNIEGRLTGSTGVLTLGQAGEKLILAGTFDSNLKAFRVDGTAIVDLKYALDDTGLSGRTLRKSGNGLLVLNAAASGAQTTAMGLNGGLLSVSNMNQLFDGNLDIGNNNGSGVLVLDGLSWADFVADRFDGNGNGANQWRITGTSTPGFAARGTPLTIGTTTTTTSTFNRSFNLGAGLRDASGGFYADAPVTLAQDIELTSQVINIQIASTGPGLSLPGSSGVVYSITGDIGDASGQTGAIVQTIGSGTANAESALNELVLAGSISHSGSAWTGINTTGPNSGRGGMVTRGLTRFASPSSLPTGAQALESNALLVGTGWNSTGGYLLTGDEDGETYDLGSQYLQLALGTFTSGGQAGSVQAVIGSHAGNVTLRNTTIYYGMRSSNGTSYLLTFARENSVLTLGTTGAGNDVRFVAAAASGDTTNEGRTAAPMTITDQTTLVNRPIVKRGTGTIVLGNVRYTDVAGTGDTTSRFAWQIGRKTNPATPTTVQFDGAVRETSASGSGSISAFQYQLSGGVLELDANVYPSGFAKNGTATQYTANTVRWADNSGNSGEGGGGFAAINGDVTVTLTNGTGNNNVGWSGSAFGTAASAVPTAAALMFGSLTSDSTVRLNNDLYLGSAGSGDNTRAILVVADTNPAKPEAIILGAVKDNTANNALTLIGDGTLVLAGNGTYNSRTRVYGGTLVIDGTLAAATYGVTVYAGGALGGTGSVARNIAVEQDGVIAATSTTSSTGLQITGTLTVDGLVGVRLPDLAFGTYAVATASGGVTLNNNQVEDLPDGFIGTAWVDGNTLKVRISSDNAPTMILVR